MCNETVPVVSDIKSNLSVNCRIPVKGASVEMISVKDKSGTSSQDFYENVVD